MTGVQTCALPISDGERSGRLVRSPASESPEDGPTVVSVSEEVNGAWGNTNGHAPNETPISGVSSGYDSLQRAIGRASCRARL